MESSKKLILLILFLTKGCVKIKSKRKRPKENEWFPVDVFVFAIETLIKAYMCLHTFFMVLQNHWGRYMRKGPVLEFLA